MDRVPSRAGDGETSVATPWASCRAPTRPGLRQKDTTGPREGTLEEEAT